MLRGELGLWWATPSHPPPPAHAGDTELCFGPGRGSPRPRAEESFPSYTSGELLVVRAL